MGEALRRTAETVAIAGAGVVVFAALGLPLPFLFGPMAACLAAALAGRPLAGVGVVATLARTLLGVAIGCSITPALVDRIPAMALTVAMVPLYLLIIGAVGVPYFRKVWRFDFPTAYYASMPGGLQDMIAFGQEAGGNVRALSLIHATRVLIIVTVAPIVITTLFDARLDNPIGRPATEVPLRELALMAAAAIIGWQVAKRLRVFGASIIGPMVLAAALSLGDVLHYRPPAEAIETAQFFIGLGIGVSYVGVTLPELRRLVLSGVVFVLMLAALAAVFALFVTALDLSPPLEGFLAFAPGGQAEMAVLSIVAGADVGFVIVHHLTRLVLVIAGAPIAAKLLGVTRPAREPPD